MKLPATITRDWLVALSDTDLVDAEARLHQMFGVLERRNKKAFGAQYSLFRGPADLLAAWDRWSRVSQLTRERGLRPRRPTPTS